MKKTLFKFYMKAILIAFTLGNMQFLISKDIDQGVGNWYEKLYWWKKAKPKYQEIVAAVKKIKKHKGEFEATHSIIISTIHGLIDSLKINNKQLFSKINNYIFEMDSKIEESYNESPEDAHIIEQFSTNRKNLEKLKQDFKLLDDLGSKVNEAIEVVLENQIRKAENYEEQAMNRLEKLENVLDDKKAKNFYEEIQNYAENIAAIEDYIQGSLKAYLNQSSIRLNQLTHEIKSLFTELENQKIYLSEIVSEQDEEPAVKEAKKEPKVKKEEEPTSFFSKIGSFFYGLLQGIWDIISAPFRWFF